MSLTYYVVIMPNPKMAVPMMGMIQWIRACADQPYQKSPTGTKNEPNMSAGMRNSGLPLPPLRALSYSKYQAADREGNMG